MQLRRTLTIRHKHLHLTFLEISLGIVFFWFGILKLFHASPVIEIVTSSFPFITEHSFWFTLLALLEVCIGIGLLVPRFVRLAAQVAIVHLLATTFGVLISTQAFTTGFPYLSLTGEFAVKNIVLIAAALLIASPDVPEVEKINLSNNAKLKNQNGK